MLSPATPLPDVAFDRASLARALDWVGMDGIALPLQVDGMRLPAVADIAVDLADASKRGIHMSRLYLLLQPLASSDLSPQALHALLRACIDSQAGASTRARLALRYRQLLLRPALASDNSGWKAYPVTLEALLDEAGFSLQLSLEVVYSSTCPASAALSRQRNAEAFAATFADAVVDRDVVRDWLAGPTGMAATPHAQRSVAQVTVRLADALPSLPVSGLVDALEAALATPVQTAVKREDEVAFAELNAANLMFCEDAARRVAAALSVRNDIAQFRARVAHLESLHAHDAVATVSGTGVG